MAIGKKTTQCCAAMMALLCITAAAAPTQDDLLLATVLGAVPPSVHVRSGMHEWKCRAEAEDADSMGGLCVGPRTGAFC